MVLITSIATLTRIADKEFMKVWYLILSQSSGGSKKTDPNPIARISSLDYRVSLLDIGCHRDSLNLLFTRVSD